MEKKNKLKENRDTPVTDGDTRPDMPVDPEKKKKDKNHPDADSKFESERLSDLNSLEDYKDAKPE